MKHLIKHHPPKSSPQAGFTIVELMIATLVFAVILTVITAGVLHFTNDYYKGINSSTTQSVGANIMTSISQALQFSSSKGNQENQTTADNQAQYICAGSKEFVIYNLGAEEPAPPGTTTGVFEFTPRGGCNDKPTADAKWSSRQDLLQPHMRLLQLEVSNSGGNTWGVSVGVAYGDADLLCDPSLSGSRGGCKQADTAFTETRFVTHIQSLGVGSLPTILCKSESGSQFCDVSSLSTTVQAREGL